MGDKRWTRGVVVLMLVAVLIGALPQSRARAYLTPPVVAPPVTGLCVTPAGVILCLAAGAVVGGGLVWAADRIAGLAPQEDGTWDWCEFDGVEAAIKCLGENTAPPLVSGDWEDLVPEFEYPPTGLSNFRDLVWDEVNYLVPRDADQHLNMQLLAGVNVKGATVEPIWDGETVIGQRFTLYAEVLPGLADPPTPCPWGEVQGNAHGSHVPEWSSCTGLHRSGGAARMIGRVTAPVCASGTEMAVQRYSGFGIVEEVWCEGGAWNMGASSTNYWTDSNAPNPAENRHQRVSTCHKLDGEWKHSGHGSKQNNCSGKNGSHTPQAVWLTKADPVMVQTAAWAQCRAEDGTIEARISSGEAVPWFNPDVPPAPSPCLAGEIPVETKLSVCPVGDLTQCREVGTVAIPTIPDEIDWECLHRLASDNPCSMWLEKWNGTEWEECIPDDNCVGWWTATNRDTHYRCGWGGDYFAASQCVPLKDFYEAEEDQGIPVTHPGGYPVPDPTAGGDPVQIGGPVPPPSAQPTSTWYGRIIQEWWQGGPVPMMESCWPQGWGLLNPLQWVLRPTMCALAWAFVPQTALEVRLETMLDALKEKTGLDLEAVAAFPLPSVGSACGWGFSSWEGPLIGEVPAVNVIPCPSDLGPAGVSAAATSRLLSHGILGIWTFGLLHRWFSLRNDPLIASGDEGGTLV